jgi:4a-hydroxytetrahydrobiopterin dehydratase
VASSHPFYALTEFELPALLASVPKWRPNAARNAIERGFEFADFLTAIDFINMVALIAHRSDHHPEWSNIYNRAHILLTTHDVGGLSLRDIAMATEIDSTFETFAEFSDDPDKCLE